jgi:hypothetical protein
MRDQNPRVAVVTTHNVASASGRAQGRVKRNAPGICVALNRESFVYNVQTPNTWKIGCSPDLELEHDELMGSRNTVETLKPRGSRILNLAVSPTNRETCTCLS